MQDHSLDKDPEKLALSQWSLASKILFRFAFAYFSLSFFIEDVIQGLFAWVPFSDTPVSTYHSFWYAIAPWAGKHILHWHGVVSLKDTWDHADSTYAYLVTFCYLALAFIITLVWSLLDRNRPNYLRLNEWFRLFLRFVVVKPMFSYGLSKVFLCQFPAPGPWTLYTTYGESSPMNLLWIFIGASASYQTFGGLAELITGLLLIVPRLTLVGAICGSAVMVNVLMLNLCYDVWVKNYSFHLLLICIVLIAPDLSRLANFFLFERKVEAREPAKFFDNARLNSFMLFLQLILGAYLFLNFATHSAARAPERFADKSTSNQWEGVWDVDEYIEGGKLKAKDGYRSHPIRRTKRRWFLELYIYLILERGMISYYPWAPLLLR